MDYLHSTSDHMHSEYFIVKMRIPLIVEWVKWFLKGVSSIHFGATRIHRDIFFAALYLFLMPVVYETLLVVQGNRDQWRGSCPTAKMSGQRAVTHSSTNVHFSCRLDQLSAFTGKTPRSNTVLQLLEMLCGFPKILGLIHWHKLKCKRRFAHMLASFVFD